MRVDEAMPRTLCLGRTTSHPTSGTWGFRGASEGSRCYLEMDYPRTSSAPFSSGFHASAFFDHQALASRQKRASPNVVGLGQPTASAWPVRGVGARAAGRGDPRT